MRKNRRDPNLYEGYVLMTVNRPDAPHISRFVDNANGRIYINMAAWPTASLSKDI